MLPLEPEVDSEYHRVLKEIAEPEEILGKYCLSVGDVLRAHFQIANYFYLEGEGLGGIGPKDLGLLQSTVYRQVVSFGGIRKWSNLFDICATLFYGIIKNHAFHDANKRTAFLCALYMLHCEEWCPSVSELEFENFTVDIAENALRKYDRYNALVKKGDPDPEVKYISWYLRNNVRKVQKADYAITFRELEKILNRFGFGLAHPHGNYIDIIKVEERPSYFGMFGPKKRIETRVCQIGFPRWTAEVSKNALKTVRECTGLTAKRGVDSASFFAGVHSMQSLITSYHEPLMRLAHR